MKYEARLLCSPRWWLSLWKRSRPRVAPRPRAARLRVEQLEDRITPTGPTLTTLATMDGSSGGNPYAGLIADSSGNLYGTTCFGGQYGDGTVFELAKGNHTVATLASFNGTTTGGNPYGGLVMDDNGDLYGTTYGTGADYGTVFELPKGSGTITTLATFNYTNGGRPVDGLIIDGSGNLYGTTTIGGADNYGTVFELDRPSCQIITLGTFDYTNGATPCGGLVMDGGGNLFGTTYGGGLYKYGTVFELAKGSGAITTLASFDGRNGAAPYAGLILDGGGNLYGTTMYGGAANGGTVFELAKGSNTITTLASCNTTDGASPKGGLVMDSSGNLYGTTIGGGLYGYGAVFELAKGSGSITTLASFNNTNGAYPWGGLIMDGEGNLYGTTSGGVDYSTVFEVSGINSQTTDQWTGAGPDSNWSDGANWSTGAPPTSTQTVLFTDNSSVKNFTSIVDSGFTNNIAGLFIDGNWGNGGGTITVDNALNVNGNFLMDSGTFGGSGAVTIAGNSSRWIGGTLSLGSGGFSNSGTLTADTSAGNLVLSGNGTLTNTGTLDEAGANSLLLENNAVLSNSAGATFDLSDNGSVGQFSGGTLSNAGTLEKTAGTGTSTISSSFINSGAIKVQTGTLSLASVGGTSTGGAFNISKNATLDLTGGNTVIYEGTYTGAGAGTVALKNGTLQVGSAGATFNMAGTLFQWTGGTIDVSNGSLTNANAITYSGVGNGVVNGAGSLINKKSIVQISTGSLTLTNGATLNNAKGASYNIESNGGISQSGGGTFLNAGTLEKTKGTGTTTLAASTLNNSGTVKVTSGTLDISAAVTQIANNTLMAGVWDVTSSSTVASTLTFSSASFTTIGSAAKVTLSGQKSTFTNLAGLGTIAKGGSLTLAGGASLATSGALTNNGSLTIGPGSILSVGGSFTQTSTATLAIQIGGSNSAPTIGQLVSSTGSVTLAGKLSVTSTVVPAVGSSFDLLHNSSGQPISGTFANLLEGSTFTVKKGSTTMTFQISYAGGNGDDVVITRTA